MSVDLYSRILFTLSTPEPCRLCLTMHTTIRLAATRGAVIEGAEGPVESSPRSHRRRQTLMRTFGLAGWNGFFRPMAARLSHNRCMQQLPCRLPRLLGVIFVVIALAVGGTIAAWHYLYRERQTFNMRYSAAWEHVRKTAELRNPDYDQAERRSLPSGVVVQFNPTHASSKRAPSAPSSAVVVPFSHTAFNFNKVPPAEFMCLFDSSAAGATVGAHASPLRATWWNTGRLAPPPPPTSGTHVLMINASPLWLGHALLVPSLRRSLPQVSPV